MAHRLCTQCLHEGPPRKIGTSGLIQLVFLAMTVVVGLFYWPAGAVMLILLALDAANPRGLSCAKCKARAVIPLDSEMARRLKPPQS